MRPEELRWVPKVELHCHLDGALSRASDCEELKRAGFCFMEQVNAENMAYTEVRFAPLHVRCGQPDTRQVIEALLAGLEEGRREFGVEYNVIVCALRHHDEETNLAMFRAAREFLGCGVCAGDLAGAEASYPMKDFMYLFSEVKKLGLPFTLHAGECGNVQNITDSVHAGAARIGHGIAMRGNPAVQKLVRDGGIGVELCPLSGPESKTGEVAAAYPLREFMEAGLKVSVNTDDRTVNGATLTDELSVLQERYGVTDGEVLLLMRNAAESSFADDTVKDRLLRLYPAL